MKIINKFVYVLIFSTLTFIYQQNSHASEKGYSLEEIAQDKDLLRHIAVDIMSKAGKINFLKDELRKKHSQDAFNLWVSFNQDSMPTVEELKKLNISNSITHGLPINSSFRTNVLRPLVGRTEFTLIPSEIIDNIDHYLTEAITNGSLELAINKMLAEKSPEESLPDSIKVTFSFDKPFAHLYQKEKIMPPKINDLGSKNNMVIVFYAEQYIKALLVNKNALKAQQLDGKINTVF